MWFTYLNNCRLETSCVIEILYPVSPICTVYSAGGGGGILALSLGVRVSKGIAVAQARGVRAVSKASAEYIMMIMYSKGKN